MEYFVKRGEQRFGPYSLSDLQQYVQSGNLVAEDLAQSEGMTDWVPVVAGAGKYSGDGHGRWRSCGRHGR